MLTFSRSASATLVGALLAVILVLSGCAGAGQSQRSDLNLTVNEMMSRLRQEGMNVSPVRNLSPNFAQDGLLVDTEYGDRMRIFEFQNSASAAMTVSRKGSSAGSAPFYYQKGNVMAVHLGTDARVSEVLSSILGSKKR
jgi:hypothetical protein